MPRFVILTHDHPHIHWDLMLEQGPALRTWRLNTEPNGQADISAEPLDDHRLVYLEYEGPVSGGRGTVARWDAGDYEPVEEASDRLVVQLRGERVAGKATFTKGSDHWTLRIVSE
ncbi:DNA polymerase ligase N-terminal domain-containing protein [Stratiformator vulcanicus]|uniref:ATP-dependent DNA ligase n=1 Tax=Stratiformator vulcanicus TaxID=2527980 RepID=A0A517R6S2_9PLAN|nr:DNA polymerase ligase N-terminal domain-containing protein [Stratiformator vulcanicus]QDT39594.1 ATP-dependent DNA ligase [Stratiformator vulcanicus]